MRTQSASTRQYDGKAEIDREEHNGEVYQIVVSHSERVCDLSVTLCRSLE